MLAVQKQGRTIRVSNGKDIVVLLDATKPSPPRRDLIQKKAVATLDHKIINFSYVVAVVPFNLHDARNPWLEEWIKELPRWLSELARHIADSYAQHRSTDKIKVTIPVTELTKKIENFKAKGCTEAYSKRYNIFIQNGWDPALLSTTI